MRPAALLLLLCGSCGVPGPTPNIALTGEWSLSNDFDAGVRFSLVPGRDGMIGEGNGTGDGPASFTISAAEWGRMTWTFGDGRTIEYQIETGPEARCPGQPESFWSAFTVASIRLHRTGGTVPFAWWDDQPFQRSPDVRFNCVGPTGGH